MSNQPLPASFGSSPKRIEDRAILTGRGYYPSDARVDGMAFAFVVRSSHAHARFRLGGVDKARAAAGIVGILTHAETSGLRPLPVFQYVKNAADGSDHWSPDYEVLPRDTVRHVGEAVAFIVAESLDAAQSAAELIDVDYQPLPLVTDAVDALAAGSAAGLARTGNQRRLRRRCRRCRCDRRGAAGGGPRRRTDAAQQPADRQLHGAALDPRRT